MPPSSTTITAFAALFSLATAQTCNIQACTRDCNLFDGTYGSCHFDYTGKGFPSLASCVCTFSELDTTVSVLDQCVLCDQGGLGINPLSLYQSWDAICETYKYTGKDTAESLANAQTTAVIQAFSQTILPELRSSYCGGSMSTSSMDSSSVRTSSSGIPISTSSAMGPSSGGMASSATGSAAAASTSSPSNGATQSKAPLGLVLGPLIFNLWFF